MPEPIASVTTHLTALLEPITPTCQVIHGDIAGNMLWTDTSRPAVIDFSPYWRPAPYATAIAITDAVLWYNADAANLVDSTGAELDQHLVRALLFRLSVDGLQILDPGSGVTPSSSHVHWNIDHAMPLIELLERGRAAPR